MDGIIQAWGEFGIMGFLVLGGVIFLLIYGLFFYKSGGSKKGD